MTKKHDVKSLQFTNKDLILKVDNETYCLPIKEISSKLDSATEMERNVYSISPSGYGIHWLIIDEDLSIDGLITLANKLSTQKKN